MTAPQRLTRHQPVRARFTAEEFMALCQHPPISDWVGKIELVEGEIIRMSPANMPHWRVQQDLTEQLRAIFRPLKPDWLVGSEPTVRFAHRTVRLPDVGVFRSPALTESIFAIADLFLAVEVADTTLRSDLNRKRATYAKAGVAHYWVVDVNGRQAHVMSRPDRDDYLTKTVVPFDVALAVPGTDAAIHIVYP